MSTAKVCKFLVVRLVKRDS